MSRFLNKLVRIAQEEGNLRAPILAALREAAGRKKVKVRRKDTGREVWVYPENQNSSDYMRIQKEHRKPEGRRSILLRILSGYQKLCLYSEDDRETIAAAVGGFLNKPVPEVMKLLEKHHKQCLDTEDGRKSVAHALLTLVRG